jgi:hypothetical protein
VVHALHQPGLIRNIHGQIPGDIRGILRSFSSSYEICHNKRGGNSAAHLLAKGGVHSATDSVWIDCLPDFLRDVVISESSTLPM